MEGRSARTDVCMHITNYTMFLRTVIGRTARILHRTHTSSVVVHGGLAALDNVDVSAASPYQQRVEVGRHVLTGDDREGKDVGPAPYDFLLTSLGMCTSLTMQMFADRTKIPLVSVSVRLTHTKQKKSAIPDLPPHMLASKNSEIDFIHREIFIAGPDLTAEDRRRLMTIAEKCPVHRTLEIACVITTTPSEDIE